MFYDLQAPKSAGGNRAIALGAVAFHSARPDAAVCWQLTQGRSRAVAPSSIVGDPMSDGDENKFKSEGSSASVANLKDSVSAAAVEIAQDAAKAATDATGSASGPDPNQAREMAADAVGRASDLYGRAVDAARHGYTATSERASAAPVPSLVITALLGIGLGWFLRGRKRKSRGR